MYEASAKADAVLLVPVWPCSRYGSNTIFHLKMVAMVIATRIAPLYHNIARFDNSTKTIPHSPSPPD